MTPLMQDIERLRQEVIRIHQYARFLLPNTGDSLTSIEHVKLQGVFRRIYFDGELMAQLEYMQALSRKADAE